MINSGFPRERYVLPIAIGCAGIVLAWSAHEPSGLLVAVAAGSILGGRRVSLLLTAVAEAIPQHVLTFDRDSSLHDCNQRWMGYTGLTLPIAQAGGWQTAFRWLSAEPPNVERAKITTDRIIRDANSAADVVSRIRALFSQMGRTRSPADITEVITEDCRLLADELATKNIQLVTEFGQSLPPALIDRVQMQQVLFNLIRNAIDSLDMIADGKRLIRLRTNLDGDSAIRVEVRDVGAGMKEPDRIFEPFFTTKEKGMGLAICRSIIESHDGRLWAISNQPRGTTLAFTLPIRAREAA